MALIKDDGVEAVKRQLGCDAHRCRGCVGLEEQVAQNLRGHDNNVSIGAELEISRHDTHGGRRKQLLEVVELLVAEGLDWGRVKDAAALSETVGDLVLTDESLAGTCLGGHENILMLGDGGDCMLLERIERECVVNRECLREGLAGTRGIDDVEKGHFVGWVGLRRVQIYAFAFLTGQNSNCDS